MIPRHEDLCAAIITIGDPFDDSSSIPRETIDRLVALQLIRRAAAGRWALTSAGERVFSKLEAGDDVPEFQSVQHREVA